MVNVQIIKESWNLKRFPLCSVSQFSPQGVSHTSLRSGSVAELVRGWLQSVRFKFRKREKRKPQFGITGVLKKNLYCLIGKSPLVWKLYRSLCSLSCPLQFILTILLLSCTSFMFTFPTVWATEIHLFICSKSYICPLALPCPIPPVSQVHPAELSSAPV